MNKHDPCPDCGQRAFRVYGGKAVCSICSYRPETFGFAVSEKAGDSYDRDKAVEDMYPTQGGIGLGGGGFLITPDGGAE
jgi:uncharacterized Zn finger protein (UPF0148 family)